MAVAPWGKVQYFDDSGNPLNGGLLYTYQAGTVTPLATYSDPNLTVPNTNPVVLDAAGRANVWISASSYKYVLKNSVGVTLWTMDGITSGTVPVDGVQEQHLNVGSAPIEGGVLTAEAVQPGGLNWLSGIMRALRNGASALGPRRYLNFVEGANITIATADNAGGDSVDVTIAASTTSSLTADSVLESHLGIGSVGSGPTEGAVLSAAAAQPGGMAWLSGVIRTLKNGVSALGPRKHLNLKEGSNVTIATADNVLADAIDATITVGPTISATTLQGTTVKTAGVGARVEMNGSLVSVYDSGGSLIVELGQAAGLLHVLHVVGSNASGDYQIRVESAAGKSASIEFYETSTLRGALSSGASVVSLYNGSARGIHVAQGARPNVYLGGPDAASLPRSSTAGFVYIPQMEGSPLSAPSAWTGYAAMVWDKTNHQLWVYDTGWHTVAFS